MKRGFTLVELSIVLVIIGLLVGGILAAQSMIETAKIQKFIKRHGQFEVIIQQYKTQYGELPGEGNITYQFTQGASCNSTANGQIDFGTMESGCVWSALSKAGLLNVDMYTNSGPWVKCANPATRLCQPKALDDMTKSFVTLGAGTTDWFQYKRWDTSVFDQLGLMSNAMAYAIDKKFDDGIALRGSNLPGDEWMTAGSPTCGANGPMHGGHRIYDFTNKNPLGCNVNIKLFSDKVFFQ